MTDTVVTLECGLDHESFMNIASFLVGHRTNSIITAMQQLNMNRQWNIEKIRNDLNQIGAFRCRNCGLWYWADQMEGDTCKIICGGTNA